MKEATGELNMTVITVVAIAAVGLLFTVFVWPNIQSNLALSTACSQVDNNGDYITEDGTGAGADGYISCNDYMCYAYYNSKTFSRKCD
jgi:hypothetical protein